MKHLKLSFLLFISIFCFSMANAACFDQNASLVNKFAANNVRLIVLCNFQGTNNVLNIVTASRSPGYALTNDGLATLQDKLPILASLNISMIYTAPAYRAQQTTNLLGTAFNLTPAQLIPESRLGMQNFGDWEGQNYNVYKANYVSQEDMLQNTPRNGESGCAVFTRTENFLNTLTDKQNQTILIITHAFNFCHISKCLTGKFGNVPAPGKFKVYDFTVVQK